MGSNLDFYHFLRTAINVLYTLHNYFFKIALAMWRIWAPPLAIIFQLNHSCLIHTCINPCEEWNTNLKKNLFSIQRESLVGLKLAWLSFFSKHNKTAKIFNSPWIVSYCFSLWNCDSKYFTNNSNNNNSSNYNNGNKFLLKTWSIFFLNFLLFIAK